MLKKRLKYVSFVLSLLVCVYQCCFVLPVDASLPGLNNTPYKFSQIIPSNIGTVRENFYQGNLGTVILINDAHTSLEAQQNISKIISLLTTSTSRPKNISTVFIEGYSGELSKRIKKSFSSITDLNERRKTADYFLANGEMTGVQYSALFSDRKLNVIGAENQKKYDENLKQFKSVIKKRDFFGSKLELFRNDLQGLKKKFYPENILKLEMYEQEMAKNDLVENFFCCLISLAEKHNVDFNLYPQFKLFIEKNNFNFAALLDDSIRLSSDIKKKVLRGEAKILFEFESNLNLMMKLLSGNCGRGEFDKFNANQNNIFLTFRVGLDWLTERNIQGAFQDKDFTEVFFRALSESVEFYEKAKKRDKYMAKNICRYLKENKGETVVLSAGGFHSKGLKDLFKEHDISYQIVNPMISKFDRTMTENYYKKFDGSDNNFLSGLLSSKVTAKNVFTDKNITMPALMLIVKNVYEFLCEPSLMVTDKGLVNENLEYREPAKIIKNNQFNFKDEHPELYDLFTNENKVKKLIEVAAKLRMKYDDKKFQPKGLEGPLEFAIKEGLYFKLYGNLYITPITESFRRHIVFEMSENRNPGYAVSFKMPGDRFYEDRHFIEEKTFTIPKNINFLFPETMMDPLLFVSLHEHEFNLYGKEFSYKEDESLSVCVYEYKEDGRRLFNVLQEGYVNLAQMYPELYDGNIKEMQLDVAKQCADLLARVHASGYKCRSPLFLVDDRVFVTSDGHIENIRAIKNGNKLKLFWVADVEAFYRIDDMGHKIAEEDRADIIEGNRISDRSHLLDYGGGLSQFNTGFIFPPLAGQYSKTYDQAYERYLEKMHKLEEKSKRIQMGVRLLEHGLVNAYDWENKRNGFLNVLINAEELFSNAEMFEYDIKYIVDMLTKSEQYKNMKKVFSVCSSNNKGSEIELFHIDEMVKICSEYLKLLVDIKPRVDELDFTCEEDQDLYFINNMKQVFSESIILFEWLNRFIAGDVAENEIVVRELFCDVLEKLSKESQKDLKAWNELIKCNCVVKGDQGSVGIAIYQFLHNALSINGLEAMPEVSFDPHGEGLFLMTIKTHKTLCGKTDEEITKLLEWDENGRQNLFNLNVSSREGGTGLGMALAWEIFNMHGFNVIACYDKKNEGLTFDIVIKEESIVSHECFYDAAEHETVYRDEYERVFKVVDRNGNMTLKCKYAEDDLMPYSMSVINLNSGEIIECVSMNLNISDNVIVRTFPHSSSDEYELKIKNKKVGYFRFSINRAEESATIIMGINNSAQNIQVGTSVINAFCKIFPEVKKVFSGVVENPYVLRFGSSLGSGVQVKVAGEWVPVNEKNDKYPFLEVYNLVDPIKGEREYFVSSYTQYGLLRKDMGNKVASFFIKAVQHSNDFKFSIDEDIFTHPVNNREVKVLIQDYKLLLRYAATNEPVDDLTILFKDYQSISAKPNLIAPVIEDGGVIKHFIKNQIVSYGFATEHVRINEFALNDTDDRKLEIIFDYSNIKNTNEKIAQDLRSFLRCKNSGDYKLILVVPDELSLKSKGIQQLQAAFSDSSSRLLIVQRKAETEFNEIVERLVVGHDDSFFVVISNNEFKLFQDNVRNVMFDRVFFNDFDQRSLVALAFMENYLEKRYTLDNQEYYVFDTDSDLGLALRGKISTKFFINVFEQLVEKIRNQRDARMLRSAA